MSEPDAAPYEEILRRYGQALRRVAWSYTRSAAESDDLFQEIALALWTALPRFRGDCSERTWVYRVGKNNRSICLHLYFQRKRFIIKRIGRLLSAYLVQSVHAPHSREVNAARAS